MVIAIVVVVALALGLLGGWLGVRSLDRLDDGLLFVALLGSNICVRAGFVGGCTRQGWQFLMLETPEGLNGGLLVGSSHVPNQSVIVNSLLIISPCANREAIARASRPLSVS